LEPAQGGRGDGGDADGRRLHGVAGAQAGRTHPEPLGPSRVGPFGLLQPLVDGAKSFLKEDIIPTSVYKPLYLLAPILALACALISIAVVPFGEPHIGPHGMDLFEISDVNIGLLVILGVTSIGVYGVALAGWSSNNKYALLGSLRASAQLISYELALGLSLVGVVLRAGTFNLRAIVEQQAVHGMASWNIFGDFSSSLSSSI